MSRSVSLTNTARAYLCLCILELQNIYIVAGKTTAWDLEPEQDSAVPADTAPTEPVVAIAPYLLSLATEVTAEEYEALTEDKRISLVISDIIKYFEYIDPEDAYTREVCYVIALGEYNLALGHPAPATDGVRAYYLVSNLSPITGVSHADYLTPAQIDSYGKLLYINNGRVIPISGGDFAADLVCLVDLTII